MWGASLVTITDGTIRQDTRHAVVGRDGMFTSADRVEDTYVGQEYRRTQHDES